MLKSELREIENLRKNLPFNLKTRDVAEILSIRNNQVYNLIYQNKITAKKVSGTWIIFRDIFLLKILKKRKEEILMQNTNFSEDFEYDFEKITEYCVEQSLKELDFTLTAADLIDKLRLSRTKIYEMLETGEIPAKKLGGRWHIPKAKFISWLYSDFN